jgi:hypothetical protein
MTKFGEAPLFFVELRKELPVAMIIKQEHPELFPWYPFDSGTFSQASESDLLQMKKYAGSENLGLIRAQTQRGLRVGVPLCGAITVAHRLLTGSPENIIEWRPPKRPTWAPIPPKKQSS